jgi:hypothetical protein
MSVAVRIERVAPFLITQIVWAGADSYPTLEIASSIHPLPAGLNHTRDLTLKREAPEAKTADAEFTQERAWAAT